MSTKEKLRMEPSDEKVVSATIAWLERFVIGLNLCPFARAIHVKNQIRYVVSHAQKSSLLLEDLRQELIAFAGSSAEEIDSVLLIHPHALNDFANYSGFLELCNLLIAELDLEGVVQIASFHPDYQFAETEAEDVTNYTNRSPYPMLHLLRESSVTRALESFPNSENIVNRNISLMKAMGKAKLDELCLFFD